MMNQYRENASQAFGNLLVQKKPMTRKQLFQKRFSLAIKLSVFVFIFFILMTFLIPEFIAIWPFLVFIEIVIISILGAYFLTYERWKFEIYLYESGVVIQTNSRKYVSSYEAFKVQKGTGLLYSKTHGENVLTPSWYILQTPDGFSRKISIAFGDEYGGYRDIAEQLLDRIHNISLPKVLEEFDAGQNIELGEVTLNKEGIKISGKKFLWSDGYCVELAYDLSEVSTGTFTAKQENGAWLNQKGAIQYAQVPNVPVFLSLLQSINKLSIKRKK